MCSAENCSAARVACRTRNWCGSGNRSGDGRRSGNSSSCSAARTIAASYLAMLERNGMRKTMTVASHARKLTRVIFELLRTGRSFDLERWDAHHPQEDAA